MVALDDKHEGFRRVTQALAAQAQPHAPLWLEVPGSSMLPERIVALREIAGADPNPVQ